MANLHVAKVEPDKLDEFAQRLSEHARQVESEMWQMSALLDRLCQSWQDEQFESFRGEFEDAKNDVMLFVREAEHTATTVRHDAERARLALNIKL